jgi:hypothetical protein
MIYLLKATEQLIETKRRHTWLAMAAQLSPLV